ncbi:MAG: tRNA lysidine(34) synthetase TilS [Geminicoccaceae bacterium]|nr:tRNA lysidine(34) synthetase TilS [Geminicoccaceae bacterium]MCS7267019.1 tRNA lysidine(34) synthetase TilS [Geminicoccaceae bacterium]MCX7628754.1 tRNA lysidine(34) synthetase TilS [Geminicoccaceae bacterium]MDW8123360.1 tRNA lysidine(34) synthetase TilS [Geminicoccaceae bacterium]MDW8341570.1 tRNA lysidine(34) synthetase TilS [Geminicoccaceae bacterium]
MSAQPPAAGEFPPLGAEEFAHRLDSLGPFERPPRLAVAVSGGPDSTALAVLARDWAAARGGSVRAFVVDHGLRTGSAEEAARVVGRLASLGIPARLLIWCGPKPETRLQERARAVRLALLETACAEAGILHLLLGHHADDQRETLAMRRIRRSGPDGLAGICAMRETRLVRILRPLLDVPKERLIATLRARGIAWEEDPSNGDPRFERARLRATEPSAWPSLAAAIDAGRGRSAREEAVARLAARIARPDPAAQRLTIEFAALGEEERGLAAAFLRRALLAVGGKAYPPDPAALERLLRDLKRSRRRRASLARCLIARCGTTLEIAPEPARWRLGSSSRPLAGAPFRPLLLERTSRLCMMHEARGGAAASSDEPPTPAVGAPREGPGS